MNIVLDLFSQLFDSARVMHSIGQPNANGTKSSAARFHSIGKRNTNCTKNACVFPASTHAIRLTRSMLLAFTWVFVTTRWIRSPMGEYRSGFYLLHRGLRLDSVFLRTGECLGYFCLDRTDAVAHAIAHITSSRQFGSSSF